MLSGQGGTKDIGTSDHCFIFNVLHKAGDVPVPIGGEPSQTHISLCVGVLCAMKVGLVRGLINVRILVPKGRG